jgi:hypothetical protein
MFASWNGSTWTAPQTLWSDAKGILYTAYEASGAGEGRVVFAVDQDGDPDNGGTLIGTLQSTTGQLLGGQSQVVQTSWTAPTDQLSHEIFVVVDPALAINDRDRSNNSASRQSLLPDLLPESLWNDQVGARSMALVARVSNAGSITSSPGQLSWRLGAENGPEIGATAIDSLDSGEAHDVVFIWDTQSFNPGEFVEVYAVADSGLAIAEFDETNNVRSQAVQIPLPSPGDLDGDGLVTMADIDAFIAVLLGLDTDPYHVLAADTDNNGTPNGDDVPTFSQSLIGP